MERAPVSVVVPTTRPETLAAALLPDLAACQPPAAEVIVVDDGCEPPLAPRLEPLLPDALREQLALQTLRLEPRRGPAAARNAGGAAASQGLLLFIDDDVHVEPDLIARVQAHFEADPELVGLTGTFSRDPVPTNLASVYKNDYMIYITDVSPDGEPVDTAAMLTAICAARAADFAAIGGLDEAFGEATVEDIELGQRLAARGPVRFDPRLTVRHLKRYRAIGLVASAFRRARDLARLLLRQPLSLLEPSDGLNLPKGFALGTLLLLAWPAAVAAALLRPAPPAWQLAAAAGPPLLAALVNAPFLCWIARRRGLTGALGSAALLLGELAIAATACVWAVLTLPAIWLRRLG